jgi:HSP20 family protein
MQRDLLLRELQSMKRRMDSLYMEVIQREDEEPSESSRWEPHADSWESEAEYRIEVDLPGVMGEDLTVEIRGDHLVVKGQRKSGLPSDVFRPTRRERPEGVFFLTFRLPPNARTGEIRADLKRGVLTVTVPRNSTSESTSQNIVVQLE